MQTASARPADRPVRPVAEDAKYLFLINPGAGGTSLVTKKWRVAQVASLVNARTVTSASESHASRLAHEAMLAGETVVACGGDGFQNIVAQQAVETGGVMTVLPLGRGNDFAASLNIHSQRDTERAIRAGLVRHARYIEVVFSDHSRLCLTCAGVGLLSEASFRASRVPLLKGRLLYIVAALISLMKLKCHRYSWSLDGTQFSDEVLILVAAASERTGGGIRLAPNAKSRNDHLNVLSAADLGRLAAIRLLVKALSGAHLPHPRVQESFHERCHIECDAGNFWASLVYGDGEYLGDLPASLQIGERPLRVLVPQR